MGGFFRYSSTQVFARALPCTVLLYAFHYFLVGGFFRHSSTSCSSIFMVTTCTMYYTFMCKDIHAFHFHFFRHSFIHLQFKCFHGRQCTYCVHGVSMCPIYGRGQVQSLQPKTFSLQRQPALRSGRIFFVFTSGSDSM